MSLLKKMANYDEKVNKFSLVEIDLQSNYSRLRN